MNKESPKSTYHDIVVKMLEEYDTNPAKADEIMSEQFIFTDKNRTFRRVCQFIFLTVLRNKLLIDHILRPMSAKKPSAKLNAILCAACAEVIENKEDKHPKIVHDWVNYAKKSCSVGESRFVNALLRKFYVEKDKFAKNLKTDDDLAAFYSHPAWIVKKWISQFGREKTIEILKNNQLPSDVFFRVSPTAEAKDILKNYEQFFAPTEFQNFYKLKTGHWSDVSHLLETPWFYIQDPSTFEGPKMLSPKPGQKILDLCASPGGKSRAMADIALENPNAPQSETILVSVDTGRRMKNLKDNLSKLKSIKSFPIECDLLKEDLSEKLKTSELPLEYDCAYLDAPCSNTGVLRRRPDARYRITESDIFECAKIQSEMLSIAAKHIKPGGRLLYSTCSIEDEEDKLNAEAFLKNHPNFKLIDGKTLIPSTDNDGAGTYLFERTK